MTDNNGVVISRSRKDPVDEKHFQLVHQAVHEEIRKPEFGEQVIIVSLSACVYKSNDKGEALQGIGQAIRCSDEQRVFSNKSDNVYVIQHCDFTPEAKDAMQPYSYHEFDIVYEKPASDRGVVRAMFVGGKSERKALDAELFVPPGTEKAQIVSVQGNRGNGPDQGAHLMIARPSASEFNNVAALPLAQLLTLSELNGAGAGLGHTPLDQDPNFQRSLTGKSPAKQLELRSAAHLMTVSPPGSLDAWYAARQLEWAGVSLEHHTEYVSTATTDLGLSHSRLQEGVSLPNTDMRMTNGDDAEQHMSLLQTASFENAAQVDDVIHDLRQNETRRGVRFTHGVGELFAEIVSAHSAMAANNEPTRPGADNFRQRVTAQAQQVVLRPSDFPAVPVDVPMVQTWVRGEVSSIGNG